MKRITVFTATYNRSTYLERLFQSLLKQTFFDFEWMIVDDGSTDDTTFVVERMINSQHFFDIKYVKIKNGGKHRAINRGVDYAEGELLLIVDSDDWLKEDALHFVDYYEKSIPQAKKHLFAGVYGLQIHPNGEVVGSTFDGETLDCTYIERRKYNINGDKCAAYYTSLIKRIPFPEFENEFFCTECLVWDKIGGMGLKIRFFNRAIYVSEYLEGGLTKQGNILYANNPKQYGLFVKHEFLYKKTDLFHASIKVYEYFLYEKNNMTFKVICNYLHMNYLFVILCILIQLIADIFRYYFKKHVTIRSNVLKNMKKA